jgi:hypothetical protein
MSVKRAILGTALLVVIVAVAAVTLLVSRLDSIVKAAIEEHGSRLTGTTVKVSGVSISLREGLGTIKGLSVGNPGGFKGEEAFSLGEITLGIDLSTVTKSPVVIREVLIRGPVVSFELQSSGRSNFDLIMDNVGRKGKEEGGKGKEPSVGGKPRLAVRSFIFEEGKVEADATAVGGESAAVELPVLRLEDIGGEDGGTAEEIGVEILTAFGGAVLRAAARSGIQRVIEKQIEKQIGGQAGESGKELLRSLLKK